MTNQERKEKIEQYGSHYDMLAEFIKDLTEEERSFRPAAGKWSVNDIIIHIADADANSHVRVRKALAEPGELVVAWDQNSWAKELDYGSLDPKLYLEIFRLLRKANYDLVKSLPEEKWASQYNHQQFGLVNLDAWLDIYVKHVPGHIEQIKRNLKVMQEQPY